MYNYNIYISNRNHNHGETRYRVTVLSLCIYIDIPASLQKCSSRTGYTYACIHRILTMNSLSMDRKYINIFDVHNTCDNAAAACRRSMGAKKPEAADILITKGKLDILV